MHMNGAINMDINNKDDDNIKSIVDRIYKYIKHMDYNLAQIYFYYHNSENIIKAIDDEKKSNDDNTLRDIQELLYNKMNKTFPFYIYEYDFNTFYKNEYPFLCESGIRDRYIGCYQQMYLIFSNQIINIK